MTHPATIDPETADFVRPYLDLLGDGNRPATEDELLQLKELSKSAPDTLDRVRALDELHRAHATAEARTNFQTYAAAWIEHERIGAAALRTYGVPLEDIAAAGIDVTDLAATNGQYVPTVKPAKAAAKRAPRKRATKRAADGDSERSAPVKVSLDDVYAACPTDGPFYAAALADALGISTQTATAKLDALVSDGRVDDLGHDQAHGGRGRKPRHFRVSAE